MPGRPSTIAACAARAGQRDHAQVVSRRAVGGRWVLVPVPYGSALTRTPVLLGEAEPLSTLPRTIAK